MARPSFYEGHGLEPDEPKLISQSVQLSEVPTKVIKVIKTVAIKVPVPYPVKVRDHFEKVESQLTRPINTMHLRFFLVIFMKGLILNIQILKLHKLTTNSNLDCFKY